MAFNAKNLSYNKEDPSFLRKLKAEHGGDRSNVQIARPKKDRLKTGDDDEDEPTMVDEHGENLGKEEWEKMLKDEKDGGTVETDEKGKADKIEKEDAARSGKGEAAGRGNWDEQEAEGGQSGWGRCCFR